MPEKDPDHLRFWPLPNGTSWAVMPNRTRSDDQVHLCIEAPHPRPVGEVRETSGGWISISGITQVLYGEVQVMKKTANLLIYQAQDARRLAYALLEAIGDDIERTVSDPQS